MKKRASLVLGLTVALSSISMVYAGETQETQEITLPLVTEYGDDIQIFGSPESTDVLQVYDGSEGTYLMEIDGTALTEAKYSNTMEGKFGYIIANAYDGGANAFGLLDQSGTEIIPFQYEKVDVLSTKWAVGFLYEETKEEDYDDSSWDGNNNIHWLIKQVDIYYLPDGKCVASLDRNSYEEAEAYGDRIGIMNRTTQKTTIYDSDFNTIATGFARYDSSKENYFSYTVFKDEKNHKEGLKDLDGKIVLKPMMYTSLSKSYEHGYYLAAKPDTSGHILIKADGTVVCPLASWMFNTYPINRANSDDEEAYVAYGYISFTNNDNIFKYADESGTITGDFSYTHNSVRNYGASALTINSSNSILAADGVETSLEEYKSVKSVANSKGMYYLVSQVDEYSNTVYGLIDWHGETVIPCKYGTLEVTGDGKYAVISEYSSYGPYSLYELTYPEDDTEATEDATAESADSEQQDTVPEVESTQE